MKEEKARLEELKYKLEQEVRPGRAQHSWMLGYWTHKILMVLQMVVTYLLTFYSFAEGADMQRARGPAAAEARVGGEALYEAQRIDHTGGG
jgi:hypothetical protein